MPLTKCSLTVELAWTMSRLNLDSQGNVAFRSTTQGPDSKTFNLAGLDLAKFSNLDAYVATLPPGTFIELDAFEFLNLVSEDVKQGHLLTLVVIAQPAVGATLIIEPATHHPLEWMFLGSDETTEGTGPGGILSRGIIMPCDAGGIFLYSLGPDGPGFPVTAAKRNLLFSNRYSALETFPGDPLEIAVCILGGP